MRLNEVLVRGFGWSFLQLFKDKPLNLFFYDIDRDGDLDLVYSVSKKSVKTYIMKNDGNGNFEKPEKNS